MDLQLFAEETAENTSIDGIADEQKTEETTEETMKNFTQKEVDDLIEKRLARAKKDIPSKDELKAFKEWRESQKTDQEKEADAVKQLQSEVVSYKQKLEIYENEKKVINKGVSSDFVEFVAFKVNQNVTEEKDFDTVLNEFLEENESYLKDGNPFTTGMPHRNSLGKLSGVEEEFYTKNPELRPK